MIEFDPQTVTWALTRGKGVIEGEAFLKTRGGDVKTCAGSEVSLIPDSPYARARMQLLYASEEKGLLAPRPSLAQLRPADPDYARARFKATCDAQGHFKFMRLAAGRYYVVTDVIWSVPTRDWGSRYSMEPQGGNLMLRVDVSEDDPQTVILTY